MTDFTAFLLAAVLSFGKDPHKPISVTRTRALHLVTPIAKTTKKIVWLPPTQAALVLVTIMAYESDFLEDREDCTVTGDGGRAISLYQVHGTVGFTREDVCSSHTIATRVATSYVRYAANQCQDEKDETIACVFAKYTGRNKDDIGVKKRTATWLRLMMMMK
jgi:hypothetical protein